MKKTTIFSGFAIALLGLFSFSNIQPASIRGKVTPAEYAINAWAISTTDTLYTTVNDGSFEFQNAEPGIYRIIIGADSPYRPTVKDSILVNAGMTTDMGEFPLEKYVTAYK